MICKANTSKIWNKIKYILKNIIIIKYDFKFFHAKNFVAIRIFKYS